MALYKLVFNFNFKLIVKLLNLNLIFIFSTNLLNNFLLTYCQREVLVFMCF